MALERERYKYLIPTKIRTNTNSKKKKGTNFIAGLYVGNQNGLIHMPGKSCLPDMFGQQETSSYITGYE